MLDHLKKMWKHYLVLIFIVAILFFPIAWIYKLVNSYFGRGAAHLALTIIVMSVLIIAIGGATQTHNICREIRKQVANQKIPANQGERQKPVVLRILDMDLPPPQATCAAPVVVETKEEVRYEELLSIPKKRRGKQSRFSEDQIWKAVLKWEKRDPFFEARTLEEFLEDEFGCSGDGILQVAPSTFYDWRRNVLREIQERHSHPPCQLSTSSSKPTPSVPNSQKEFS
jgi:hypothetical protein